MKTDSSFTPNPNRYDGRMPYRQCGKSGLKLPLISLGCWHNFGGTKLTHKQRKMIYTAFDQGITHFDLANNYGSPYGSAETNFGKLIKELPRDELLISTKAGYDMWAGPYGEGGSRKYLLASLDQSLKRLNLNYVDIFYSHRFDPSTPLEETLGALDSSVQQGKALYIGISSYSLEQTQEAVRICKENNFAPLLVNQLNYSMFNRWIENDFLNMENQLGLGVIAFCPLYQGLLTDKYLGRFPVNPRTTLPDHYLLSKKTLKPKVIDVLQQLNNHAKERGQMLAQMALAWVLRDSRITSTLIGISEVQHILDNIASMQNTTFSNDEISKIDMLLARLDIPSGCDRNFWVKS